MKARGLHFNTNLVTRTNLKLSNGSVILWEIRKNIIYLQVLHFIILNGLKYYTNNTQIMETVTENGWVYPGLSASIQHLFITYKMELDKR